MVLRVEQCASRRRHRVVVLAKEPVPGRVKTRLCPPLTPDLAAQCHEAFVVDTLTRLGSAIPGAETLLAVSPSRDSAPRLDALGRDRGWQIVEQATGHLGMRMRELLAAAVDAGRSVVLVGADTPDLPTGYVRDAIEALADTRVVLGPASDGGYYLVGCRDRVPDIFGPEMPWGTERLFDRTLARLSAEETAPSVLPEWHDVDDWAGLRALAARIAAADEDARHDEDPPSVATHELIDQLRAAGLEL